MNLKQVILNLKNIRRIIFKGIISVQMSVFDESNHNTKKQSHHWKARCWKC